MLKRSSSLSENQSNHRFLKKSQLKKSQAFGIRRRAKLCSIQNIPLTQPSKTQQKTIQSPLLFNQSRNANLSLPNQDMNKSKHQKHQIKVETDLTDDEQIETHIPKHCFFTKSIDSLYANIDQNARVFNQEQIVNTLKDDPPKLFKLSQMSYAYKVMVTEDCLKETYEQAELAFVSKTINEQFSRSILKRNHTLALLVFQKMSKQQKNTPDEKGFTPVHLITLAVICGCSKELLQLAKGIIYDPQVRICIPQRRGWNPLQDAIYYKHIPLATHLFKSSYLKKRLQLVTEFSLINQILRSHFDFRLEIDVKLNSYIPFVSNFTPTDTLKIYKSGQSLRLDYTLVGFENLQCKRRNMSCIFNPKNNSNIQESDKDKLNNKLVIVNHSKQVYTDFFEQIDCEEMLLIIQDLLSYQMKRIDPSFEEVRISKDENFFGNDIIEQLANQKTVKYTLNTRYTSFTEKRQPKKVKQQHTELNFLQSYQVYSQYYPQIKAKKKNRNKVVNLSLWLADKYALRFQTIGQIFQLLGLNHEILYMSSQFIQNYVIYMQRQMIDKIDGKFPVKIQIPLNYSLYFEIQFKQVERKVTPDQVFMIPQYEYMPRKQFQRTMQRSQKRLLLASLFTR